MNPDDLRALYASLMASHIDFRIRIWETIKAASLLATGSLVAIGGLLASGKVPVSAFTDISAVLILIALFSAWWMFTNVERENALQYHDEFPLYQIEKLLGLHEAIPEEKR